MTGHVSRGSSVHWVQRDVIFARDFAAPYHIWALLETKQYRSADELGVMYIPIATIGLLQQLD